MNAVDSHFIHLHPCAAMEHMNHGSYNSSSDSPDQDDFVQPKRPKREKRKARHAVYRALPGYPVMYGLPAGYNPYPMSVPAPPPQVHVPRPAPRVEPPQFEPPPAPPPNPVPVEANERALMSLSYAPPGTRNMPELQTVDIRVPPTQVPLYDRR